MTRHEWQAEQVVDAELAARLVAEQFPQLAGLDVRPFAEGWDNTVHVVDGTWAFRFPRRAIALPGVARETALLPVLAGRLPLAVPAPELLGRPSPAFDWPFTGARLLPGVELADSGLTGRRLLAVQLGGFLRALHDPALARDLGEGLPLDPLRRSDPASRGELSLPRLERLFDSGDWPGDDRMTPLLGAGAALGPSRATPVLVHGDLHVRHVLVDGPHAVGVIDWGDVCLADPSVDLALAYAAFDGEDRAVLLAEYGAVDRPTEVRARVLAVYLSTALAEYGIAQDRPALRAEALLGLARAVG